MLSIENFYWVLYENLLKPVELDCWYYYPFGTTNNLSCSGEFKPLVPKKDHHVLFHYDQEPLWTNDLGPKYDSIAVTWSKKRCKILANSEKSNLKKYICQNRNMQDWYFFYHGFAALDWFRDSQYIVDQFPIKNVFLCFNHLVRDLRSYRISLLSRLMEKNIMDRGLISFHGTTQDCQEEIDSPNTKISNYSKSLIYKNIISNSKLPLIIDDLSINSNASAHFGYQEYKLWQQSFLHIVNETVFYDQKLHLTEKIFKPIVSLRPFVLTASFGNLKYLRSYGFRTFDNWWDEGYDSIEDPDDRLDAITTIINDICQRPFHQIQEMLIEMQPTLEHNKNHFFGEFRKIIVDELVDNFDVCIRSWNNGRIDEKTLPLHPDIESVKKILLK
jgi:hypothetical protein